LIVLSHSPIWFQLANFRLTTYLANSVNSLQEQIRSKTEGSRTASRWSML
jgi:hypothetical protein